jgi:hypothetical protein
VSSKMSRPPRPHHHAAVTLSAVRLKAQRPHPQDVEVFPFQKLKYSRKTRVNDTLPTRRGRDRIGRDTRETRQPPAAPAGAVCGGARDRARARRRAGLGRAGERVV